MTTPKEALEFYADPENWKCGSILDMESSHFDGWTKAQQALASLQGEDAVEKVARIIGPAAFCSNPDPDEPAFWRKAARHLSREKARAILATGLVPDETEIRADEREKCAKAVVARSDAVMAEAEAAHDDDNYDLYERLECETGNYMDIAAAIRSGGGK